MKNNIFLHLKTMKIHEKIRTIRQSKGFTQDYVASILNLDTVNYGRIERGQSKLTIDRFLKILKILDVNSSIFFEDKQEKDIVNNEIIHLLEKIYKTEIQILEELQNGNNL